MTIELNHLFIRRCLDPQALIGNNLGKLNTFTSRLEKQSKTYAERESLYVNDVGDARAEAYQRGLNTYKGWAFELFVEFFIKSMGLHPQIGVLNYELVDEDADMGVDGHGSGLDGKPLAVQAKYRQADYELTSNDDNLTNFTNTAFLRYGVEQTTRTNLLIITTCKGLHWKTEKEMFCDQVRVLNRKRLRKMVDNPTFWSQFLESWEHSIQPQPV